jgi:hypothetical protein
MARTTLDRRLFALRFFLFLTDVLLRAGAANASVTGIDEAAPATTSKTQRAVLLCGLRRLQMQYEVLCGISLRSIGWCAIVLMLGIWFKILLENFHSTGLK